MRLLIDEPADGVTNMARDEALLDWVGRGAAPPTLRFYRWEPPTISLGYFQAYSEFEKLPPPAGELAVVRRTTGGGAILHDREWTYSLALPASHPLAAGGKAPKLYELMHDAGVRPGSPWITSGADPVLYLAGRMEPDDPMGRRIWTRAKRGVRPSVGDAHGTASAPGRVILFGEDRDKAILRVRGTRSFDNVRPENWTTPRGADGAACPTTVPGGQASHEQAPTRRCCVPSSHRVEWLCDDLAFTGRLCADRRCGGRSRRCGGRRRPR